MTAHSRQSQEIQANEFKELNPPRYNYVDAEQTSIDNVDFYIKLLEDRIYRARIALDSGVSAFEVAKILQG